MKTISGVQSSWMKIEMSPKAVTRRLGKAGELVRACRALAGAAPQGTNPGAIEATEPQ